METHGVQASLDLATGKVEAIADPAQLEQVVLNLVVNARQALEKAAGERANRGAEWTPSVRVTTRVGDGRVELEVEDNGPGIPALDLPQIFDPFWTTREEGEGPGLGLSVVHGIVTSHRGTIDVDSAVGGGTRFTVRLPRAPADVAPPPAADAGRADTPATLRARPLDILVVDDELVIRELLQRFLASRGHAVVAAADGAQALRLAERSSFDVVISDLRMPGMDGREVIRRLRELPTFASTTFILSTGDAESDAALEGAPGDVPIVPKPFDMDALIGVVEAGRPA